METLIQHFKKYSEGVRAPKGFSYVKDIAPTIKQELRYCSNNNFIGTSINGYEENVLIITTQAATALKKVQTELLKKELSLKIFDAYRPQKAVNHFVEWARVINDTLMKQQYYPSVNKRHLFKKGYISSRSGHSRGSTVDLTIIDLETKEALDMGSAFDYFGELSWVKYKEITGQQKSNRMLLNFVMLKYGFKAYAEEWWHFTLKNEPYKKTYFDFNVE